VILCRRGNAENALHHLHQIMGKLKLTVNEEKTRGAVAMCVGIRWRGLR
jgi:hypothetical protein